MGDQYDLNESTIGWYGKLPALGDFVSKQLPDDFIKPWDTWLQAGMLEGKQSFEDQWSEQYLTFPIWRFLIDRDVFGDHMWAGLLIPSADRVGRLFPLTVALPVNSANGAMPNLASLDQALAIIQQAAGKLIDDDDLEGFEQSMQQVPSIEPSTDWSSGEGLFDLELAAINTLPNQGLTSLLSGLAMRELFRRRTARGLWWLPASETSGGTVRASSQTPSASFFLDLIKGAA
jgi:type VI secretion system protein ImpM